jgi:hypothetical protein
MEQRFYKHASAQAALSGLQLLFRRHYAPNGTSVTLLEQSGEQALGC